VDLSADLYITQKGVDEVKQRTYKLGMKKRSVLILLDKPKSLAQILGKTVLPDSEVIEEVTALIKDGFIQTNGAGTPGAKAAPAATPRTYAATGTGIDVDDEIILSEAKFLLSDFAVDSFGTHSQSVVDAIRACKTVADFRSCLNAIQTAIESNHPDQLPILHKVVAEINETA
jgi:hypothetical protein